MLIKRWLDAGRNTNTKAATSTSLSLSSPRGTAAARRKKKRNGKLLFWIRYAKQEGDLALLVLATLTVLITASAGIYTLSAQSSATSTGRRLSAAQNHPSSSEASPMLLFSRLKQTIQAIHTLHRQRRHRHRCRPRGHRYFDYWQDEEHDDYEAFPWKYMKRSFSKKSPDSNAHDDRPPLDDESYVPTPTSNDEEENQVENDAENEVENEVENENLLYYDRSLFYAQLRESYESFFPPPGTRERSYDVNAERCLQAVEDLQTYTSIQTHLSESSFDTSSNPDPESTNPFIYDIHNCPETPPKGYPVEWNLVHEVLSQWPADDPELPASGTIHQGLCVFDLRVDYEGNLRKATSYRNAEVPFVVKGDPSVAQTVERWNAPNYLSTLIGDQPQGTEKSQSGTFTYWTGSGVDTRKYPMNGPDYKPPTEVTEMTFEEWIKLANVTDSQLLTPESPHYYFKVVGCAPGKTPPKRGGQREDHHSVDNSCSRLPGNAQHVSYLADELPFYTQTKSSLYIKEPLSEMNGSGASSKALNCRFGMKGVMATNHFDGERNFVTVLSGERRYILAHPKQCGNMALFPYGHPSARHSAVDWANPDLKTFPEFEKATGNEVVLQAGDSLFLPSLWFHYIVSMSMNVQCNTRSGMDQRYVRALDESCGW